MQQRMSASDRLDSFRNLILKSDVERAAVYSFAVLVAYALVRSLVGAATSTFSYDELCGYIVVRQATVSQMWGALERAVDGQPPGFYVVERLFASIIPNEEIAFRLPFILGFCITTVCIFIFVRRRSGSAYALVCAAVALMTSLFQYYATDARPYSLVIACVAIVLLCYQRAPATGWMLLMGLMFAVSLTLNYFAVYALLPFGIAEFVLLLTARDLRWRVWMAFSSKAPPTSRPLWKSWPCLVSPWTTPPRWPASSSRMDTSPGAKPKWLLW